MNDYSPFPGHLVGHGLSYPVDAADGNSREVDVPDGVVGRVQGCERGAVAVLDPIYPEHADCAQQGDHKGHNPRRPAKNKTLLYQAFGQIAWNFALH